MHTLTSDELVPDNCMTWSRVPTAVHAMSAGNVTVKEQAPGSAVAVPLGVAEDGLGVNDIHWCNDHARMNMVGLLAQPAQATGIPDQMPAMPCHLDCSLHLCGYCAIHYSGNNNCRLIHAQPSI